MNTESFNSGRSKESGASSGENPPKDAHVACAFDTSVRKAKEWTYRLVDADAPAGYTMMLEQADSLLAEWIVRAWKKQK